MLKTYRNKLYAIPDAAKRAKIEEDQLRILISVDAVKYVRQFGIYYIGGEEIPNIEKKWLYFNRKGEK